MTGDDIPISLEDIERDLEETRKAEARIAAFFRRGEAVVPIRTRGGTSSPLPPLETPTGIGRLLMARCPADTQQRYRTLLHSETAMPADGDHGLLIGAACAILEGELRRLLADPVRPFAGHLIAALDATRNKQPVGILDRWHHRVTPTTLGTLSLILYGLRKGCEKGSPDIARFLAGHFRPRFADLLKTRKVEFSLESIRTRFRNPADHAERVFDAAAYREFAHLVIANRQFAVWDADGPDPSDPDPGCGVLYHHLQQALGHAAPPTA
jgi:hypothetical protein